MNIPAKRFHLDKPAAKLMGVCAGISAYTGIDATIVRIGFVLGTIFGFGSLLLIYLLIGFLAPKA
jgi:phage shock protein PspC (stress-responsive transcriptional regulator)